MAVEENLIELPPLPPSREPSLNGGRAPVRSEVSTDGPFVIAGLVPPAISGLLLLIGPNPVSVEDPEHYRPDHGDGMLHRLALAEGRPVAADSRFVRTRTLVTRWGAAAPVGPLAMGGPRANRALVHVAGRLLALDGAGYGYRITTDLRTAAVDDFETMLTMAMGSSVVVDARTGAGTFLGSDRRGPSGLVLCELTADGMIARSTQLPLAVQPDDPPLEVLDDLVAIGLSSLELRWASEERTGDPRLVFDPERPSAIGLLPRGGSTGSNRWCAGAPGAFAAFVSLIASGTGADGVVLRQEPHREADDLWRPERTGGVMTAFSADARTQALRLDPLDDVDVLGVSVDRTESPDGRRHAYGVTSDHRTVIKYNIRNSTAVRTELPDHLEAGCPLFWRDPDGRSDEEGWLMVPCLDRNTERSAIVIFDATRTTAEPEAVIGLPNRIPLDATGLFLVDRALT